MKKNLYSTIIALMMSSSMLAQGNTTESGVKFSGIPIYSQGVSPSGRFITGAQMYNGTYCWDTVTDSILWVRAATTASELCFYDTSENWIQCGQDDDQHPAYYENGAWHPLSNYPGTANRINGDGTMIIGNIYLPAVAGKPYNVQPTAWYRQADGTYKAEALPNPQTDWLGGPTQFNTARAMSEDGRFVVGVQVEDRGRYYSCILWEKQDDGTWTYSMPFAELEWNVEEFQKVQAEEPKLDDYIFVAPGHPNYLTQVQNFQREYAEWQYNLNTKGRTGYFYAMPPVIMSETGYTLAVPVQYTTWEYTPGDVDVPSSSIVYPVTYNLLTKEFNEHKEALSTQPYSVTEAGDMLTGDGYDPYIVPHDSNKKMKLEDWLKDTYNFDLWDYLPANTAYIDDQGISGDGKKIFLMCTGITLEGELDFMQLACVTLPDTPDGIVQIETSDVNDALKQQLFNLRGQRIANPEKGINIIGGRKVLIGNR